MNDIYYLLNTYFNKINKSNKINILIPSYNNIVKLFNLIKSINKYSKIKSYYLSKLSIQSKLNKNNLYKMIDKTFISIGEIKHFSNNIIINIYIYNREKYLLLNKLRHLNLKKKYIYTLNKEIIISLNKKLSLFNNKILLYNYYISRLFLNNLKYNVYNLIILKKVLSKLLMKKVTLNITSIKYSHLNNNILVDSIISKLNNNRKISILKALRKSLIYAKIMKLNYLLKIKKFNTHVNKEIIERYKYLISKKKYIIEKIFENNSNIHIAGLKLEGKGRLTRRLVAARAIKKINYKGNLNNIYSSINKNSSFLFKGYQKSNLSKTTKNSYNVLGTYGIKYEINSY
jgi:hypothetical protein